MEIFLALCVAEHSNGNRPGPHFNKAGWQNIVSRFNNSTGKSYTRKMLKNKWDVLKQEWGIWQKLVRNETGLGWDVTKGTVVATPEWWTRKLQVTPEAAKFRICGSLLLTEQEILFGDCVANGAAACTPNSGVMPQHMADDMLDGVAPPLDANVGEPDDEIDNEKDTLPYNDVHESYSLPSETPTQANQANSSHRGVRTFPPRSRLGKGKKTTTAQIVAKCLQSMASKFDNLRPQVCPCKHSLQAHNQ